MLAASPVVGEGVQPKPPSPAKAIKAAGMLEVRFLDDSVMKVAALDEPVEVVTPYGKLLIPFRDIRRLEIATRHPAEDLQRADAAIANLGKADFKQREAASAELLALKEKAYPALLKAAKHTDPEVVRRAGEVLEKIRETIPAERLEIRPFDVVHTDDSKITGRLTATSFKATTLPFGDQPLKLDTLRELRAIKVGTAQAPDALPDPGSLQNYSAHVGKTFHFKVTTAVPGMGWPQGALWGTDIYTTDSTLALAALHAGMLKAGEAGVVKVTIVGPQVGFQASVRNGVNSNNWGQFPAAFRFER